jgi:hypothetical protein
VRQNVNWATIERRPWASPAAARGGVKVIVAPLGALRRYVSREFASTFASLRHSHPDWCWIDTNEVVGPLPAFLRNRYGALPNAVLFWESYPMVARQASALRDAGARIYLMTDDLHRPDIRQALPLADRILSTYAPCFADFFPDADASKVTWVPHAAGPDFLLPVNDAPARVVFVSGAVSEKYPLRAAMRDLALRRPELARLHEHPGYHTGFDYGRDARVGRGYAEAMRSCLAAFTDGLRYRYLVAKHFEIPATGALLIAGRACAGQLAALGFDDGVHYLSASADDLEEVVERVLDPLNRAGIDAIRRRGHALVHARHTTEHRAAQIAALCE